MRETLMNNPAEHPAVRAWTSRRPAASPAAVTALKVHQHARHKPCVWRLHSASPDGADVIASRCPRTRAIVEQSIYTQVLPGVGLPSLEIYHTADDADSDWIWLFMEDAGDDRYCYSEANALLAAEWMARLHTASANVADVKLPQRGCAQYLAHLRQARILIIENISSPTLSEQDRAMLRRILKLMDAVEGQWGQIECACDAMTQTLVHGDFTRKNVRIRRGAQGNALLVLDWEMAGWGLPAVDLHTFARHDQSSKGLHVYASATGLSLRDVIRMTRLGMLFRQLAAIHWASESLAHAYVEKAMEELRCYETRLTREVETLT